MIVLTGGTGYIGSHIATELLRNTDNDVLIVDSLERSQKSVISNIERSGGRSIDFLQIDLKDPKSAIKILKHSKKVQAIIHLAAYKDVNESTIVPLEYYENNMRALASAIELSKIGEADLIFSSSASVYGLSKDVPVNEESKLEKPESPYAHTKSLGEHFVRASCGAKGLSLRYFNPAGADEKGLLGNQVGRSDQSLVTNICRAAFEKKPFMIFGEDYQTRDGTCIRDFVHVTDIALAHVAAIEFVKKSKNYEVINLGTGVGHSVQEIVKSFTDINKVALNVKRIERRKGDVVTSYANNDKAQRLLGWNAEKSLNQILSSAWKWYISQMSHRNE